MKKTFRNLIITLVVLFLAFGALLQTKAIKNYAKKTLIKRVELETGYKVEIGEIHLFPSFQMSAREVTVFDHDRPLLKIDHIYFGIYPIAFWEGHAHFSSLNIEGIKLLQIPEDSKNQVGLYTLEKIPYEVLIDEFEIHDLIIEGEKFSNRNSPIEIKGTLSLKPEDSLAWAKFALNTKKAPKTWLEAEISYDKGKGTLQLNSGTEFSLAADFLLTQESLCRIPQLHASYGLFTMDGNLSLTTDGIITESSLIISSSDLSEQLPATGQFHGGGKILGNIWSPEIDLNLESDFIDYGGNMFTNVSAKVRSRHTEQGLKGRLDLSFLTEQEHHRFSGDIFWDEALGPIPSHLRLTSNLEELSQFLAFDLGNASGQVDIDVAISTEGIKGIAELTNGILESVEFGTIFTNINATIEGNLQKLTLKKIEAGDGNGGKFSANGTLLLDREKSFPLDIALRIKKAAVVHLDNIRATASGELTLTGPVSSPTLKGTVTTHSASFHLPEKISAIKDTIDITYINLPDGEKPPTSFRKNSPVWPLNLDVKLNVPGKAKVKGRGLSSEWKGEAEIKGTPASPLVHGEFKIIEGKYLFRGKAFKINKGTYTLAGDPDKKATLYVIAEMDIDRITVEAIVKGPPRNPSISFRSTPPMPQREILSWILFNKGASEISPFQGTQLNQSVTKLSTASNDGPDIMTRIGDTLGLDRIEIGGSPGEDDDGVSLKIGKYLSEGTYVSYSRNRRKSTHKASNSNQMTDVNCVSIETSLSKYITFQAEVDDDSKGQVNLLWKKDY
ncbi:MAG: hypothetical protein K940chlam7_00750 [Chlamydiae bacterium]|nr:hypothetical protein [Chlamydiota bacterium]